MTPASTSRASSSRDRPSRPLKTSSFASPRSTCGPPNLTRCPVQAYGQTRVFHHTGLRVFERYHIVPRPQVHVAPQILKPFAWCWPARQRPAGDAWPGAAYAAESRC